MGTTPCIFLKTFCLPPRFFVQLDGTYFSKSKSIPICRHIAQYEQTFLAALSIPHKVIYIYTATASVAQRWELAAPFPFLNLSQKTLYEHLFLCLPQLQLYSG